MGIKSKIQNPKSKMESRPRREDFLPKEWEIIRKHRTPQQVQSFLRALPYNWGFYTVWQYTSSPLDQDTFNGAYDRLQALANG